MKNIPDDLELIQLVLAGNLDNFEELINRYQRAIYNFSYLKLNDYTLSQDIAQETFLKAFKSLEKYNSEYKFITWLLAICNNICINHFNKEKKKIIYLTQKIKDLTAEPQSFDAFEQFDNSDQAQSLMDNIKEEEKTLLFLRFWQELSHKEIADIMDMPPGTVRSKLCRLLKKMRHKFLREIKNQNGV
jgi:RNA polymerase sigma-70 factor (ECF subfamily)